MKTAGIIAEYNPFHKGHAEQLRFLREKGMEQIVVVMSGNFVQRGAPAWTDKYLRTKMALAQGADFVFELPVLYALSSGEGFAFGGVSLLDALGLDCFCFGSECGEVEPLREAADIFVEEPPSYKKILQEKLRQGLSYPAARECALSAQMPGAEALLREPNNILGIEYLKAVKRLDSSLVPITLKRSDAGYHSKKLSVSLSSSATAIREKYSQKQELKDCEYALPEEVFTLLQSHSNHFPVEPEDFSLLIYYRLASALRSKTLTRYGEISGELANRIEKNLGNYETLSKFTETLKTKNITHSRINRSLFQLLLGVENRLLEETKQSAPYLRLLGMRQSRSGFLRDVSHIPVITKVADYKKILGGSYSRDRLAFAMECFELDLFAADVYRQVLSQKTGVKMYDEYRSGIVLS